MILKRCSRCHEHKPLEEFNKRHDTDDRLQHYCADCNKEYKREWDEARRQGRPLRKKTKIHPRVARAIRSTAGGRGRKAGKRVITLRAKDPVEQDRRALIAAWPDDGLCAISGEPMLTDGRHHRHPHYAEPDRIDPNYGYVAGNVQWVRKMFNEWKSDAPLEALVTLGAWAQRKIKEVAA